MIISAPGKLFIAGEWAILEPGNPGIVAAIDRRAYVKIEKSRDDKIHIKIENFNTEDLVAEFKKGGLRFQNRLTKEKQKKLSFIKSAIEIALRYLGKWRPFEIEADTREMSLKTNNKRQEIGLGSSAAIVVAAIAGILNFHGINIKRQEIKNKIYKLSTIAHYFSQGEVGSGFDVAASTFGGIFLYKRFDQNWLQRQIRKNKSVREIINLRWPGFYFENLRIPQDFNLIVAWTGESASTSLMVRKLYKWRDGNKRVFKKLSNKIGLLVKKLTRVWEIGDKEKIIKLVRLNEDYLRKLGEKSKLNIETKLLKRISEIANRYEAAGKLSGAGGGDCGIAITFDKKTLARIKKEWKENGIYIIDTDISFDGVRRENQI